MIILDTNVISACMRARKNAPVLAWLDRQPPHDLWTTTVCLFELRYGIENLPDGDGFRAYLETGWLELKSRLLGDRILAFDMRAADHAAAIAASRRRTGRSIEFRDTFIAGIARAHGATLATRNLRDFHDAGIRLVNPWTDTAH
jgi:predicted nucleic acid-binding protein